MKLEDIQPTMVAILNGITEFKAANVLVLADDGNYPKSAGREAVLTGTDTAHGKGLVVIVFAIQPGGIDDVVQQNGFSEGWIVVHVAIEEEVRLNRGTNGTGIVAEKALRLIRSAVAGKPKTSNPRQTGFLPMNPPFVSFGTANGARSFIANFQIREYVEPTS